MDPLVHVATGDQVSIVSSFGSFEGNGVVIHTASDKREAVVETWDGRTVSASYDDLYELPE